MGRSISGPLVSGPRVRGMGSPGAGLSSLPVNTVAPVASSAGPLIGDTVSVTTGTWIGVPTPTFTYQWQRGDVVEGVGTLSNIGGATSNSYARVAADVGYALRCVVTATNAVAAVSANSNTLAATLPEDIYASTMKRWEAAGISGSPIDSWTSKTGSIAYTATLTARPAVGTINGINCADGDGVNDIMSSTSVWSDVTAATAWELMAVIALDAAPADGAYTTGAGIIVENIGGHGMVVNQSGVRAVGYDGSAHVTDYVTCAQDGTARVVGARLDGGNVYASVGATDSAGVACASETLRASALAILDTAATYVPMDGRLGAFLIIPANLSTGQRSTMRNWYRNKFNTAAL